MLFQVRLRFTAFLIHQAWFFGVGFAQSAAIVIKATVASLLGIGTANRFVSSYKHLEDISPALTWDGIALGCFLGLLTPILASILPIRSALGKNLHDSLDTRQSKTMAIKVHISRTDPTRAISWNLIAIGFALSLFGGNSRFYCLSH